VGRDHPERTRSRKAPSRSGPSSSSGQRSSVANSSRRRARMSCSSRGVRARHQQRRRRRSEFLDDGVVARHRDDGGGRRDQRSEVVGETDHRDLRSRLGSGDQLGAPTGRHERTGHDHRPHLVECAVLDRIEVSANQIVSVATAAGGDHHERIAAMGSGIVGAMYPVWWTGACTRRSSPSSAAVVVMSRRRTRGSRRRPRGRPSSRPRPSSARHGLPRR
jgi:hypothetical protein